MKSRVRRPTLYDEWRVRLDMAAYVYRYHRRQRWSVWRALGAAWEALVGP